jgi:hypothetical protein
LYRSFISFFFSFILRANKWLAHVCITFLNSSFIGIPAEMLCDVYTFLTQMFFFYSPRFPFNSNQQTLLLCACCQFSICGDSSVWEKMFKCLVKPLSLSLS